MTLQRLGEKRSVQHTGQAQHPNLQQCHRIILKVTMVLRGNTGRQRNMNDALLASESHTLQEEAERLIRAQDKLSEMVHTLGIERKTGSCLYR